MALPGLLAWGARARDVYNHACRAAGKLARPHGARDTDAAVAAAVPPRPLLSVKERDWLEQQDAAELAEPEDGRQLWLFSYTVMARIRIDEKTGEAWNPELPANYPARRPRFYGHCMSLGLGTKVPCAFATCRHSLLSDEFRGECHGEDADLWSTETCALAVAQRCKHDSIAIAGMLGFSETSAEETQRSALTKFMEGLGVDEFSRSGPSSPSRFRWPKKHGCKLDSTGTDGLADLIAKMPERPAMNLPPVRHLSKDEVRRLYGAKALHPRYGKPMPAPTAPAPPPPPAKPRRG